MARRNVSTFVRNIPRELSQIPTPNLLPLCPLVSIDRSLLAHDRYTVFLRRAFRLHFRAVTPGVQLSRIVD